MSDEQFHEFHLDGKQMVFLFMASTVVAVVIFLCGVMVGRGVRANKGAETLEASAGVLAGPGADVSETAELAPAVAPATTPDDARASEVAASEKPALDEAPPPVDEAAPPPKIEDTPRAAAKQSPPATEASPEPQGTGYAVQVATVQKRADADTEVKELKARGYDAFVLPAPKSKPGFRVRVGKFKTYDEAKAAKQRLQKIKKYHDAWVTS
jgi:cell division septation protein DedD